jgi:hypothetical protein
MTTDQLTSPAMRSILQERRLALIERGLVADL